MGARTLVGCGEERAGGIERREPVVGGVARGRDGDHGPQSRARPQPDRPPILAAAHEPGQHDPLRRRQRRVRLRITQQLPADVVQLGRRRLDRNAYPQQQARALERRAGPLVERPHGAVGEHLRREHPAVRVRDGLRGELVDVDRRPPAHRGDLGLALRIMEPQDDLMDAPLGPVEGDLELAVVALDGHRQNASKPHHRRGPGPVARHDLEARAGSRSPAARRVEVRADRRSAGRAARTPAAWMNRRRWGTRGPRRRSRRCSDRARRRRTAGSRGRPRGAPPIEVGEARVLQESRGGLRGAPGRREAAVSIAREQDDVEVGHGGRGRRAVSGARRARAAEAAPGGARRSRRPCLAR